jgi:RNA recognition motif-containing protein
VSINSQALKRWNVACSLNVNDIELARDSFNIYVGELPTDVTEEEIRAAFASAGEVLEARVMRDRANNSSKGYGFVHFATRAGYEKAMTAPEFQRITLRPGGRSLRVKSSEQKTVLFLGNLPMELTQDEVRDAVQSLLRPRLDADAVRVDVKFHPDRRSKGFGFASFDSNAQADFARRVLGASVINGRQVNASWAEHPPTEGSRGGPVGVPMHTTLYVSGLNATLAEDVLRALFEQFGDVTKCLLPRAPNTDELKGYAFVQLPTRSHCDRAIAELDDTEYMGVRLKVSVAKPPGDKGGKAAGSGGGPMPGANASSGFGGRGPRQHGHNPYAGRGGPPGAPYGGGGGGGPGGYGAQGGGYGAYPPQGGGGYGQWGGSGYQGYGQSAPARGGFAAMPYQGGAQQGGAGGGYGRYGSY